MRFYGRGRSTQIASTVAEPMIALTICSIEFAAFPSTPPVFGSSMPTVRAAKHWAVSDDANTNAYAKSDTRSDAYADSHDETDRQGRS